MAQQINSVFYSMVTQSGFFEERQHVLLPISDTISSKLLNYDDFNALCGMIIKMWEILSFNFFLREKLQDKLSDDCITLPDLFISLQRGLIVH